MKNIISIFLLTTIVIAAITCKKTPEIPTGNKIEIGETTIDSVSYYNANVSTIIIATGSNEITQHGHCWSTEEKPTIENNKTTLGKLTEPKTYTSELTNLIDNTTYYVRSYITYTNGTVYGNEQNIKTLKAGKPIVLTTEVTNVTLNSAVCGGIVQADSGLAVTSRGICWDTDSIFTITNCLDTTIIGTGLGNFTSEITNLTEGVTYYATAYASNEKGTSYGVVKMFTTVPITTPTITTNEITGITTTSATSGGNVTNNGNGTVTARGVCWNTAGNPTLENNIGHTTDGDGTGIFISNITGLTENTTYYTAAFATNEKGTSYGEILQFTTLTLSIPSVSTNSSSNITANTVTSGGNITSDGNSDIIYRGVCWSTLSNPTLVDNYTVDGSGMGNFISNIIGLNPNTQYYTRAYATNAIGTAYGIEISFTTLPPPWQCGDQISYSGQSYNTILIGIQCWMAENLNVGTMIPSSLNQSDNGEIEKYCYNDNPSNCLDYGGLYLWDELMHYTSTQGAKGICPTGWHIPTDEEWKDAEIFIGMSQVESNQTEWRGTDEGNKLKSTSGWYNNGNGTNSSSFSALPTGFFQWSGLYLYVDTEGYWWSSSAGNPSSNAWYRSLSYDEARVYRSFTGKFNGMGIRCLKD